jgi:hypothetical protein
MCARRAVRVADVSRDIAALSPSLVSTILPPPGNIRASREGDGAKIGWWLRCVGNYLGKIKGK